MRQFTFPPFENKKKCHHIEIVDFFETFVVQQCRYEGSTDFFSPFHGRRPMQEYNLCFLSNPCLNKGSTDQNRSVQDQMVQSKDQAVRGFLTLTIIPNSEQSSMHFVTCPDEIFSPNIRVTRVTEPKQNFEKFRKFRKYGNILYLIKIAIFSGIS